MKRVQSGRTLAGLSAAIVLALASPIESEFAQSPNSSSLRVSGPSGRPVTIPVTVRVREGQLRAKLNLKMWNWLLARTVSLRHCFPYGQK